MTKRFLYLLILQLAILSPLIGQQAIEKKIQTDLILAEDGSTIQLEEGTFQISQSLSMDGKKNMIIRGKGIDKTILSFKNQAGGAEGIKITNCENIILEDMTVQDSKGDLIKTMHVKGITFRRIKAEWTGKPSPSNGSYALYPVLCENVLIDSCIAIGASDAGIYVGQSKYIEVKNSTAFQNVAGIEIENSQFAEVHHNKAYGNTGGILVFDLPDLVQKKGGHVKVYQNEVIENNLANFAPKGNIVARVPKGTGMLVLATSQVEIFNNKIHQNKTMGVGIISYHMTENKITDLEYDPYPTAIEIRDNDFERKAGRVPAKGRFGQMYRFKLKFGRQVPNIVYDGILDPKRLDSSGEYFPSYRICIRNNTNQSFANIDAEHDFKNIQRDVSLYDCHLQAFKTLR
ncbi:parallel beta-helix domain-containing protein [Aquirufa salirivi]|uniref:Parallel beta-helix domain-containing protein n=1 Tax=Aquirufa salirivi TaxID=3104729 RepID=A0ABW8RVJ5_9BACT